MASARRVEGPRSFRLVQPIDVPGKVARHEGPFNTQADFGTDRTEFGWRNRVFGILPERQGREAPVKKFGVGPLSIDSTPNSYTHAKRLIFSTSNPCLLRETGILLPSRNTAYPPCLTSNSLR